VQVDYGATAEELESHFNGCGSVSRVTILCDKFSGHPKGLVFIFSSVFILRTGISGLIWSYFLKLIQCSLTI